MLTLPLETMLAKEAKTAVQLCRGKHLDCLNKGGREITVRTKWQSGSPDGDTGTWGLNGNGLLGNERFPVGKANPT